MENKQKEEMYCLVDGCEEIDETFSAYCWEHGRSPHGVRNVKVSTENDIKKTNI